ncbi:MAG: AtpZ/AtpI family protein [Nitrosomonadales bacterium]|nr:AtpZ/AtpI family protein [Nitrosomonadales bacterium]
MSDEQEKLEEQVEKAARRLKRADRERPTVLAQTAYVGVLGLLFVLPVIGGAYLGSWIDGLFEGYSMRWTLSLIFLGIVVGAVNVYYFVRE